MNKMKRIVSVIMLLALAAALCACGKSYGVHACAGKWKCVSAPVQMNYSDIRLELTDTSFTYTLVGEKDTTVMTGTAKSIGDDRMVLYIGTQQQLDGDTSRVIQERTVDAKESEKNPVYAALLDNGRLELSAQDTELQFTPAT